MISQPSLAKVDLVTVPNRDTTQLTIYNSADLTLVRDGRALTLKKGKNKLQFSWANTLIDPTSLEMLPKANADQIDIFDLTYPPRVKNLGVWNIKSGIQGKVPVEITYLTSGIRWRAFYMGTLTSDEKTMRLKGYVRVSNHSGEDYENAQIRLIVGKVHLLDQIAQLAQRPYPYGRPDELQVAYQHRNDVKAQMVEMDKVRVLPSAAGKMRAKKEIIKEGLSEYFLYTIEGAETIPSGWAKRLPSFDALDVPVVSLYKFEQRRYGDHPIRFLGFKNDKIHKLGETPIPGGQLKVFRIVNDAQHLSYEGQSSFKYIPVDEDVELSLGSVQNVMVTPTLMDYQTNNYMFDPKGRITGWDEVRTFRIKVKNTRTVAIKLEIKRNFNTNSWDIENSGEFGEFEKEDKDTVKYTLQLSPRSNKVFDYILTTYQGSRQDDH
jgi:hypothetical protein